MININRKYHIVYKTINLTNQKFYIGIHSTNDIKDKYLGSGHALLSAIKKYGKINFIRKTLSNHKTREEALQKEKEIVTKDFIKNKNNYNLTIGGEANAGWTIWNGPHAERVRKIISIASKGYKNPDFIKRWMPLYEALAPMVCFYICCTNLPDRFIQKIILKSNNQSVKIHRLINYYEYKNYIKKRERHEWQDYFGSGYIPRQKTVKTLCITLHEEIPKELIYYKSFHKTYIDDFYELKKILIDRTISDSMIVNNSINISFKKGIYSRIKYFEYLGFITKEKVIRINIRTRLPNAQRATGLKTLYRYNKIKNLLTIENEGNYHEYTIDFDGKTIQKTRLQHQRYENWRIN